MTRRDSIIRVLSGVVLTGAVLLLSPSCATKGFMRTLHEESMAKNREIESRLAALEATTAVIDSMTQEQYGLIRGTRAVVSNQSQNQQENLLSVSARLDNLYTLMNELNQKLQAIQLYGGLEAPPQQAAPSPGSPSDTTSSSGSDTSAGSPSYTPVTPSSVDPNEVYNSALKDLNEKDYDLAESRFMAFLIQFPRHELAGNAQYWLGEVDYGKQQYDLAISGFQKVIENYPKSEKVAAAMLKMGYAQIEVGKKNAGIATLRKLVKEHKGTQEAKLATAKLRKLGR